MQMRGRVFYVQQDDSRVPATKNSKVEVAAPNSSLKTLTDDDGYFILSLPEFYRPGNILQLEVEKVGWVIDDGGVSVPEDPIKQTVEIILLPKGSKRLTADQRLDREIGKIISKAKEQVTIKGKPQDLNLDLYLKDWATKWGFSPDEVQRTVDEWADEVEKTSGNLATLGKAAFVKREFAKAQKYYQDFADTRFKRAKQGTQKAEALLDEAIRAGRGAGDTAYNNYQFTAALTQYQRVEKAIDRFKKPEPWAAIQRDLANTYRELAERTEGAENKRYFDLAMTTSNAALSFYTRAALPTDWASIQNNLGVVLQAQGQRAHGETGNRLLEQAAAVYTAVLEVYTRASNWFPVSPSVRSPWTRNAIPRLFWVAAQSCGKASRVRTSKAAV